VDELAHRPPAVVTPGLQDDPDVGAPVLVATGRVLAQHRDPAAGGQPETLEDLDGRRLARTVGTEEDDDLTAVHPEGHAVEHVLRPVAHAQVGHVDDDVAAGVHPAAPRSWTSAKIAGALARPRGRARLAAGRAVRHGNRLVTVLLQNRSVWSVGSGRPSSAESCARSRAGTGPA